MIDYSIYDKNGHLCSLDSEIVERNVPMYLTGFIKPIYDSSLSIDNGFPVKELGPILEWYISSFDGSEVIFGIVTDYADYLLIKPHSKYEKYMKSLIEKIHLSKVVIKTISENQEFDDPTYEDVLSCVVNSINPVTNFTFTEEDLIIHAQFVLDLIIDYDSTTKYYFKLADTQCIKTLCEFSGATKHFKYSIRQNRHKIHNLSDITNKQEFNKAITTEVVKDVFENIFSEQLDQKNKVDVKTIFDEIMYNDETDPTPIHVQAKMFVLVKNCSSPIPIIGRIESLFKDGSNKMAHLTIFTHSFQTIIGDISDPQEIFLLKKCYDININDIIKKLNVTYKIPDKDWFNLGNSKLIDLVEPIDRSRKNSFFYQFRYDDKFGRFEYLDSLDNPLSTKEGETSCINCLIKDVSNKFELLEFIENDENIYYFYNFKLRSEEYKIGNFIYLQPGIFTKDARLNFTDHDSFVFNDINKSTINPLLNNIDETEYPEYYRKIQENNSDANEATPNPFEIAEIISIYVNRNNVANVKLIVRRMYRAEQIPLANVKQLDMNMLYWSDEMFIIEYEHICGKCYVSHIVNFRDPASWSADGPDRFYFKNKFDFLTSSIEPEYVLSSTALLTGREILVNYDYNYVNENKIQYIPSYKKISPLKGLDIFAGCGGLSKGLEESGLLKCQWAIECDDKAAEAFQLNNPDAIVFVEDCNKLLKLVLSGNMTNEKNQRLPQKGEVDFICGGPPCQGFSSMNRFNLGQYSLFRNSLIMSFLSYIDYYRPKFFVIENVRNFVSYNKGIILRSTLRCITRIGYQCTFGILQAGNFGVPQTRRRLIIMAAAPGEILPLYPEPTHVFNKNASGLIINIDNNKFRTNCNYIESAPMRTIDVEDAFSDLPEITSGANCEAMLYKNKPITHFQRLMRSLSNSFSDSIMVLVDHICKDMSPLVQARIELIPIYEGSDWRDLPNKKVTLSDGTTTNLLMYTHYIKNDRHANGVFRGVCRCVIGLNCNPQDRQTNTIIPWCLPHTASRHNDWAGLYGRLPWSGFCSTTITNPEPMGKQGRVLHPEQHRVVSVRECARSQGFKDSFVFCGSILDKHQQIGNAVPPPMSKAIGYEIIKAIDKKSW